MKTLVGSVALLSSLALVSVGCGEDQADDLTQSDEALLTCGGWHHGGAGKHHGHHHHRHHHGHGGTGMGGSGMGGTGGAPHLPAGNGGSTGMGGSTGTGGSAGSGMGGAPQDPRCEPMSGIVSWWHADGDYDDAVGSNDGTTGGNVGFTAGMDNQAFNLTGVSGSYVEVPADPSLMPASFTLDAWINQTSFGGRIIDKALANGQQGYMMDVAGDQLRLFISGAQLLSSTSIPAGMFTHVAALYDGAHMAVYINGALSAESTFGGMVPSDLPVHIGADSNGGSLFTGIIDEPRVFNRALTADEVALLFWQGTNCH